MSRRPSVPYLSRRLAIAQRFGELFRRAILIYLFSSRPYGTLFLQLIIYNLHPHKSSYYAFYYTYKISANDRESIHCIPIEGPLWRIYSPISVTNTFVRSWERLTNLILVPLRSINSIDPPLLLNRNGGALAIRLLRPTVNLLAR
jgi:hypothetical protein